MEGDTVIITVQLEYRHAPTAAHRDTLDIRAYHAYRDAQGRLVTPSHRRQVELRYPKSITDGLREGIQQLDWLLRMRHNPFMVEDTAEPEERAWRLVG